ncbi:MAG: PAS domain-containing protein [Planctomycetes bacterium]|nr:PAS domain-containing protein [Planctomycetota bacterium]
MGIGRKLVWGFLSVALLGVAIGYISVDTSQKALQESIGENSALLASEILDKIDRNFSHRIGELQCYAHHIELAKQASLSSRKFGARPNLQNYISKMDRNWTENKDTPAIQNILNNELSKKLQRYLEFSRGIFDHSVFAEIYVTNKYGVVIGASGRTSDFLQADEQWYQAATGEEEFWVGDIEYDESSDTYASDIVIKLYDEKEGFVGILKAILDIEEIIHIINEAKAAEKHGAVEFKLLTKGGENIYSTDKHKFFENVSGESKMCLDQSKKNYKHFVIEGKELFAHAHSRGYKSYKGLSWVLIVKRGEQIFAPVVQLRNHIFSISAALLILAMLIGILISRAISKHITRLKDATVRIGEGKLDTIVDIESNDDVGELAESLNEMTRSFQEVTKQLNMEISERKQAERLLRNSEERLLKAQQVARMGFMDWNLSTNAVYWSDEIFDIYGVDPQQTKPTLDLTMRMVYPDDMELVQHSFGTAAKGISGYDINYRILRPDGQVVYVHAQAELIRDDEGVPLSLLATIVDITEYKKTEEELNRYRDELETLVVERGYELKRDNERLEDEIVAERKNKNNEIEVLKQQMEFVLGATKTGLDIIDSEFNIRYIDPEWKKVYGETEGKKCYEYFMDRTKPCSGCGIPKALKTKKPVVSEEILAKEGNRPIRVTTIPFQAEDGEWLVAEVNVDINDMKEIEGKLNKCSEQVR